MSLYFCRSPPPSLSSLILMPKRASSSVLSSKATKRSKTGDQKTIHSFFSSSSRSAVAKQENRELDLKTVIIDLCLEDECEGKQEFSASALAKEVQEDVLSAVPKSTYLAEGLAPQETESNQIKYIDPNASPLLFTPDLSSDPLEFPLSPCPWDARFPAPYAFLSYALVTLSSTRSRISITNTLVNTLRLLIRYDARQSLLPALYLLSNSVAPSYEGVELKIGPSTLNKAIQSVSGISSGTLKTMSNKLGKFSDIVVHFSLSLIRLEIGDPGDVAFEAKSSVRTLHPAPPLQLASVHANLLKISALKGQTSAKQKQSIVEKLLVAARGEEVRYLVRMLSLNLSRGGQGDYSDRAGKGVGFDASERRGTERPWRVEDAETLVKQVYVRHPHFGHIVNAALDSGLEHLSDNVQLTVGIPLHPTLGSPTRSLDEIYDRLGDLAFTAEFKYDGQRVQVHASRNAEKVSIRLFSRHLEDMTQKYPDIVQMTQTLISQSEGKLDSFILDAEVVAVDPHTGTIRTFQELSNRPRKGVSLKDVKATVCVYAFDLMYLNGEVLLDKAFRERRWLLRERFPPLVPEDPFCSRLAHAESVESEDGHEAVEEFWERAVASQCEGLMIKLLDSGEVFETTEKTAVLARGERNRFPRPTSLYPRVPGGIVEKARREGRRADEGDLVDASSEEELAEEDELE
ncbi:ATP-dependent DNA ligase [Rhizoctonia solani]|uniref:ATP-dependent DNA ligase n=1 Tax=Rhizoctonia solani TaxID=456999 RepID=A0A8H8T363_9AGAM|nr:ATP-dependent DNA ligase [Rhizoctonia solani]QRW27554.1 ATP-dependent DNA ligase [Rhizoctonia solani]